MIVMSVPNNYMYEIQMKINKKKLSDVFLLNEKVYILIMKNLFFIF